MSKVRFYSELDVPEDIFLHEALMWSAFGRVPVAAYNDDSKECRFDDGTNIFGYDPSSPYVSPEECAAADITPDPRFEWNNTEEGCFTEAPLELLELLRENEYAKIIIDLHKKQKPIFDAWLIEYESYVDPFKIELCLQLRRAALKSRAKFVKYNDVKAVTDTAYLSEEAYLPEETEVAAERIGGTAYSDVPAERWRSDYIDWDSSMLLAGTHAFIPVRIKFEDVVRLYPPQKNATQQALWFLPEAIAIDAGGKKPENTRNRRKPGRPSFDWDSFHVEVARRHAAGTIPEKQDAAIVDMQEWCLENWKHAVCREAIRTRLSKYRPLFQKNQKPTRE